MAEPLFSIGSYAAATGLTASALRFYAESGILLPDHVDSSSGYRYYSASSLETARLISRLRAAGTPLDVLRLVIDSEPEEAALTLERLADDRAAEGLRASEILREVAASLRQLTANGPVVNVNAWELAAALRAAARFVDCDPPFDRITLIAAEDLAFEVVATDRFRLSAHRLADAFVASGSGRASLDPTDAERLTTWLELAAPDVEVSIGEGELVFRAAGAVSLHLPSLPDCLPDHRALIPPIGEGHIRAELLTDLLLDLLREVERDATIDLVVQGDLVVVGDHTVGAVVGAPPTSPSALTVTATLLSASLAALPRPTVLSWAEPVRPAQLSSPVTPNWRTVIMPARPATGPQ